MLFVYLVISILCVLVKTEDIATTLYPYIYTNLNNWPCVRLLNATGTIGCHALKKQSGILYQTTTQLDLNNFIQNKIQDDFALVIPYNLLSQSNLASLSSTGKITGLIVLLSNTTERVGSPDSSCPNCEFGLYANDQDKYIWNPNAQNLIEQNFEFPIFAILPEDEVSQLVYDTVIKGVAYNEEREYTKYPLKAMDFNLFMWAAINSETCLRRGWCQVVGGMSVFSSPSLNIQADDKKPIVVVASNIDGRSFFHDLTVGSTKDVSGLVTVLAIADALKTTPKPLDSLSKHIVYTLFTAESWGFAGSQRFVNDISTSFQCTNETRAVPCPFVNAPCSFPCVRDLNFKKINFDNIESIFEFQSVSGINNNYTNTFYTHVDDVQQNQGLLNTLKQYPNIQQASVDGVQRKLPPSSSMSFLQKKRDMNAVVITDYQKSLGDYYNSDLDIQLDLSSMTNSICGLVNSTANAIYNHASNENGNSISANCTLVSSLLDCLISNFSCTFMQDYFNVSGMTRLSHYSSVYSFENPQAQLLQRFVFSFLSGVTGQSKENQACQTIKDCGSGEYCIKQKCVLTFTTYHEAYGTGLQYDEKTGVVQVVDSTKGTWTESTWDPPAIRVFLITSKKHQVIELIVGLLWISISFISVLFLKKYLTKTFKTE